MSDSTLWRFESRLNKTVKMGRESKSDSGKESRE